jgi:hypothetical protein
MRLISILLRLVLAAFAFTLMLGFAELMDARAGQEV